MNGVAGQIDELGHVPKGVNDENGLYLFLILEMYIQGGIVD